MTDERRQRELAHARQEAIDVLLRLMGCTDLRTANCEHVGAIKALAAACNATTAYVLGYDGPLITETHFREGAAGHREGRI